MGPSGPTGERCAGPLFDDRLATDPTGRTIEFSIDGIIYLIFLNVIQWYQHIVTRSDGRAVKALA